MLFTIKHTPTSESERQRKKEWAIANKQMIWFKYVRAHATSFSLSLSALLSFYVRFFWCGCMALVKYERIFARKKKWFSERGKINYWIKTTWERTARCDGKESSCGRCCCCWLSPLLWCYCHTGNVCHFIWFDACSNVASILQSVRKESAHLTEAPNSSRKLKWTNVDQVV